MALLLLLVGCGDTATSGPMSVMAPPVRLSFSSTQCTDLQRRNLPCLPNNLQLVQAPITNATGGAISDAQAQEWGKGMLLSETYDDWAVGAGASTFLTGGADSDPSGAQVSLFPKELAAISKAQGDGGKVVYQPLHLRRLAVIKVPDSIQATIRGQALTPQPYAMVGEVEGPASLVINNSNGSQETIYSVSSDKVLRSLVWGEYRRDPDLGLIWYEGGIYGCDDAQVAPTCTQALG
ncbi:MAG: hypothetical protein ACREN8_11540 [Candidatus Dormibacteraceae bacterium]